MSKALVWLIVLRCLKKEHSLLFSVKRNIWISSGSTWTRVWLELISAVEDTSQLHLQNLYSDINLLYFFKIWLKERANSHQCKGTLKLILFLLFWKLLATLSHVSGLTTGTGMLVWWSVCWSTTLVQTEPFQQLFRWTFIKISTEIPSAQRIFLYAIMRLKLVDGWIVIAFATNCTLRGNWICNIMWSYSLVNPSPQAQRWAYGHTTVVQPIRVLWGTTELYLIEKGAKTFLHGKDVLLFCWVASAWVWFIDGLCLYL